MPLRELKSRDAVLQAIREFDDIGQEAFLSRYGFGEARSYVLHHDGHEYDSKAIAGVAYGYQFPARGPLAAFKFSGGASTVAPVLRALGFEVRSTSAPVTATPLDGRGQHDALPRSRARGDNQGFGLSNGEAPRVAAQATDDPLTDIEAAGEQLAGLTSTERVAVIKARVGQGVFRDAVLEGWGGCCAVTGVNIDAVLVASHIKPWRDSTNDERLDPCNGLPLIGTLDRLFDAGLITFADDGKIVISSSVPEAQLVALGVSRDMRLREARAALAPFLGHHRSMRFERGLRAAAT